MRRVPGPTRLARVPATLIVCLLATLSLTTGAPAGLTASQADSTPVDVFPIPGDQVATPNTQIAFRGVPTGQLANTTIAVTGSSSGPHTGRVVGDSDGLGGSFLPDRPFTPGEIVTVSSGLNIVNSASGTYQFKVATPAGAFRIGHLPAPVRVTGDVWRYRSRLDLAPASVQVLKNSKKAAPGDIFIAPLVGPVQRGPMILDSNGGLVWFKRLTPGTAAADFRVQTYHGRPVLTWWQGIMTSAGVGTGQDVINDSSYKQIAVVNAANGLTADLHEFQLTPQGTALLVAYYPVWWNASAAHGATVQIVLDSVVQEIDIPTGLVLFQWDSLDHVPVEDTHVNAPRHRGAPFDYFHVNSVDQDADGNLVISARNTWAAYKVDHGTGNVFWELGGNHSTFAMGPGAAFAFQHDVRVRASNDTLITAFDDGAGPPAIHNQSRGITLALDFVRRTATLVDQDQHSPALLADFEGNDQALSNGDQFLGWGQQPYLNEFNSRGKLIFDARFVGQNTNYRAYRFVWSGNPKTHPAIAARTGRGFTYVYASWNGATNISGWRVLAGSNPKRLRRIRAVRKTGFETATSFRGVGPNVAVQALDFRGRVLDTSPTVTAP